jgi:Uma2 family endonuclease
MPGSTPETSPLLRDAVEGRAILMPWTVDQYHAAIRCGCLESDPTWELLDGWIVRKEQSSVGGNPLSVGNRHRVCLLRLAHITPLFDAHHSFLQTQQPIALPPHDEPEPDAAVIRGDFENFTNAPAGAEDVLCVIEVAEASLRRDQTIKNRIYASAGILLYVVVNLVDNQVELYAPQPAGGYGPPRVLKKGKTLHIPTATSATVPVPVEHLLP